MECKQCGKDVPQTEGKRAREYCNDACRKAHNRTTITGQFESLPADVQRTINSMASSPADKQARTERAIRYQQMCPSPYSKGLNVGDVPLPAGYKTASELKPGEYNRVSKPGDPDYSQETGTCHTCGAQTQIKSITKCHKCIDSKELVSA